MKGRKINRWEIKRIIKLRERGHSLPEIIRITKRGSSTVFKYIKDVKILPQYHKIWREKQGGSKRRMLQEWNKAKTKAQNIIPSLNKKERIIVASCLYWGEGTKSDFSLSNTDAGLIKTFVRCLKVFGINKKDLRVTVRIYSDLNRNKAKKYWAKIIGIPRKQILNVNVLQGKKSGKLKYGMCRIRITKGGPYLKLIKSIIELIKLKN